MCSQKPHDIELVDVYARTNYNWWVVISYADCDTRLEWRLRDDEPEVPKMLNKINYVLKKTKEDIRPSMNYSDYLTSLEFAPSQKLGVPEPELDAEDV